MLDSIKQHWQNYIDGQWVEGGAGTIDVLNPANGTLLATQACADESDVDRAVKAAKRCHESGVLSKLRPVERGRMVQGMGQYLLANLEEIATVLCLDAGKPYWEAVMEVEAAARYFEYYGNQAETLEGRSIPLGENYFDFTVLEPYGVSAQVIPWNYPLEMTARSLSAALAAGNACVIKTPEIDPLVNEYIAKAAEHVNLPQGAVNVICGYGHQAGAALTSHPGINQIVFTGSVQTGQAIAKAAADIVVPAVLELGGKSAAIVFDDADIDRVVEDVRWGIYFNAGQVCSAMSRLIIHEDVYDQVVEKVTAMAQQLSVQPGIELKEFGANMGPLVSEQQLLKARDICQKAAKEGARITTGGERLNQDGFFLEPTVIADVTPEMNIAKDEIFGPVIVAIKFSSDKEAIMISNGTDYGLVGGVYSKDINRAMLVARDVKAGQIFVNEWYAGGVETPFGGYGKSGYGREKGREALLNYVQTKNIAIAVNKV